VPPWWLEAFTTLLNPALYALVELLLPDDPEELPQAEATVASATVPAAMAKYLLFRMIVWDPLTEGVGEVR
jgi:hypothetical protein